MVRNARVSVENQIESRIDKRRVFRSVMEVVVGINTSSRSYRREKKDLMYRTRLKNKTRSAQS